MTGPEPAAHAVPRRPHPGRAGRRTAGRRARRRRHRRTAAGVVLDGHGRHRGPARGHRDRRGRRRSAGRAPATTVAQRASTVACRRDEPADDDVRGSCAVIRIAAVGDIHVGADSVGAGRPRPRRTSTTAPTCCCWPATSPGAATGRRGRRWSRRAGRRHGPGRGRARQPRLPRRRARRGRPRRWSGPASPCSTAPPPRSRSTARVGRHRRRQGLRRRVRRRLRHGLRRAGDEGVHRRDPAGGRPPARRPGRRARRTDRTVALLHYSPVEETLRGERLEIYPFLGSHLLAEAIDDGRRRPRLSTATPTTAPSGASPPAASGCATSPNRSSGTPTGCSTCGTRPRRIDRSPNPVASGTDRYALRVRPARPGRRRAARPAVGPPARGLGPTPGWSSPAARACTATWCGSCPRAGRCGWSRSCPSTWPGASTGCCAGSPTSASPP